MRPVVEEIIGHGKKFNLGLEAGFKAELHAVIGGHYRFGFFDYLQRLQG